MSLHDTFMVTLSVEVSRSEEPPEELNSAVLDATTSSVMIDVCLCTCVWYCAAQHLDNMFCIV